MRLRKILTFSMGHKDDAYVYYEAAIHPKGAAKSYEDRKIICLTYFPILLPVNACDMLKTGCGCPNSTAKGLENVGYHFFVYVYVRLFVPAGA